MGRYIWGPGDLDRYVEEFTKKTDVGIEKGADYYLLPYAIEFEKAYLEYMTYLGVLTYEELNKVCGYLDRIKYDDIDLTQYEDLHTYIEEKIIEKLGRSLYLCRSRNDVIIAIERLYLRDILKKLVSDTYLLYNTLVKKTYETIDVPAPVHTHYVLADSIPLATYFISYLEELNRIIDLIPLLTNILFVSPLGSGAVGGCPIKLDFTWLDRRLGFNNSHITSLYGINSRKTHNLGMLTLYSHYSGLLARISRDLMRLSTQYNIINLPKRYISGSSQLIHKSNPDILELIIGLHTQISSTLTIFYQHYGEESGYQRFQQQDKYLLIKHGEELILSMKILSGLLSEMRVAESFNVGSDIKLTWLAHKISWKYRVDYRDIYKLIKNLYFKNKSLEIIIQEIARKYSIDIDSLNKIVFDTHDMRYNYAISEEYEELIGDLENKILRLKKLLESGY